MAGFFKKIRSKPYRKQRWAKEKDSQSHKRRQLANDRHAERMAHLGRLTEERVENLLRKKLEGGELIEFKHYPPNSPEDQDGRDFRVTLHINGSLITVFFGVTISMKSHQEHLMKHPGTHSIVIPPEMRDERIWERIVRIAREEHERLGQ